MRKLFGTVVVAASLIVPLAAFAASTQATRSQSTSKPAAATKVAGTHTTTGIVKSIDDNTLVITRSSKQKGDMTFTLEPSTHREGTVAAGSQVSVRYRRDGSSYVATAVNVHQSKAHASKKSGQ